MEILVFASFVVIQYAAKQLPAVLHKSNCCTKLADALAHNHYAVWLAHPAVLHGLHDYAVHFIVYSGYVLRAH